MFTAAMVVCSTLNITNCHGMSSQEVYWTEGACMDSRVKADKFFEQRNYLVMGYKCINWGEAT
jgi:hypothetical protein